MLVVIHPFQTQSYTVPDGCQTRKVGPGFPRPCSCSDNHQHISTHAPFPERCEMRAATPVVPLPQFQPTLRFRSDASPLPAGCFPLSARFQPTLRFRSDASEVTKKLWVYIKKFQPTLRFRSDARYATEILISTHAPFPERCEECKPEQAGRQESNFNPRSVSGAMRVVQGRRRHPIQLHFNPRSVSGAMRGGASRVRQAYPDISTHAPFPERCEGGPLNPWSSHVLQARFRAMVLKHIV